MQYLVTGEFIDPGPLLPPDQLAGMIRQAVLPSHDVLTNLKAEGNSPLKNALVGRQERLQRCSRARPISWPMATGGHRAAACASFFGLRSPKVSSRFTF